jgi:hypothetical protein
MDRAFAGAVPHVRDATEGGRSGNAGTRLGRRMSEQQKRSNIQLALWLAALALTFFLSSFFVLSR